MGEQRGWSTASGSCGHAIRWGSWRSPRCAPMPSCSRRAPRPLRAGRDADGARQLGGATSMVTWTTPWSSDVVTGSPAWRKIACMAMFVVRVSASSRVMPS